MKVLTGTFTGNGTSQSITGLNFTPTLVIIKAEDAQAGVFKTDKMPTNESAYLNSSTANLTTAITSLDSGGFSVGSSTTANNNGSTMHWIALTDPAGVEFCTFTYTGNGTVPRNITGFGFQPDFALVKLNGAATSVFRDFVDTGNAAHSIAGSGNPVNAIRAFVSDGITINSDINVNTSVYYGFAFRDTGNKIFKSGSYTGNGIDNTSITGVGFQSAFVMIKNHSNPSAASVRFRSKTFPTTTSTAFTTLALSGLLDDLQVLESDGFQVGTSTAVNTNTAIYHYIALSASFTIGVLDSVTVSESVTVAVQSTTTLTISISDSITVTESRNVAHVITVSELAVVNRSQDLTTIAFGFGEFAGTRYRGQNFTPTVSANLLSVGFDRNYIEESSTGVSGVKVYIDTVAANVPIHDINNAIYSFVIPRSLIKNGYGDYILPVPLALTAGTKYCFYLAPWDSVADAYVDDYQDLRGVASGFDEITNSAGTWFNEGGLTFHYAVYMGRGDGISVSESVSVVIEAPSSFLVNKSDSITVTEAITARSTLLINKSESITVSESRSQLLSTFINKNESVTITEAVSISLQSATSRTISVSDSITVTELVQRTLVSLIDKSETISVRDFYNYLSFDGTTNAANWGNILLSSSVISVAFWMQPTSLPSNVWEVPLGYGNTRWFFIYTGATTQVRFGIKSGAVEKYAGNSSPVGITSPKLFVGTYDPDGGENNLTLRIYRQDGTLFQSLSSTQTGDIDSTTRSLKMGHDPNRNYYNDMNGDNLMIFSRVLTQEEQDNLALSEPISLANLDLWARMDEGEGLVLADSSGNGHTGTIQSELMWQTGSLYLPQAVNVVEILQVNVSESITVSENQTVVKQTSATLLIGKSEFIIVTDNVIGMNETIYIVVGRRKGIIIT